MRVNAILFGSAIFMNFGTTIIGNYLLYLYQWKVKHNVPPPLPTTWHPEISDTWVLPPGTQISRLGIIGGCSGLAVIQVMLYQAHRMAPQQGISATAAKVLLLCSVLGVFLLSVVGAVCEGNRPTCRGNIKVHSFSAVIFFILYDGYMIATDLLSHSHHHGPRGSRMLLTCTLLSILTKLRWTAGVTELGGSLGLPPQIFVAVFEWCDVGCILVWTFLNMIQHCPNTELTFSVPTVTVLDQGPTSRISLGNLYLITTVLGFLGVATAAVPLALEAKTSGGIPSPWPHVAAAWSLQPRNWIAHWGGVTTGVLLVVWHLLVLQAWPTSNAAKLRAGLGFVSAASVALYGVVTPYEFEKLNTACGTAFFVISAGSMAAGLPCLDPSRQLSATLLVSSFGLGVVSLSRFGGVWGVGHANALEWVQWLAFWVYLVAVAFQTGKGAQLRVELVSHATKQHDEAGGAAPEVCHPHVAGYVKMRA